MTIPMARVMAAVPGLGELGVLSWLLKLLQADEGTMKVT
jgi:hypothetical protein